MLTPFPYYQAFTWGTPTIPNMYWDAYSYEERIKKLCMEYGKIVAYLNAMTDTVNEQYLVIEKINDELPTLVAEVVTTDPDIQKEITTAITEYIASLVKGTTYGELKDLGFIHEHKQYTLPED